MQNNSRDKLIRLLELGVELDETMDEDLLLEKVLSAAREFTNADAGSIYIKNGGELSFRHAQNETLRKRQPEGKKLIYSTFTIPINHRSIAGYVALEGKTLNIDDAYALPSSAPYSFDPKYDKLSNYRTRSILTVPIKTKRKKTLGVIQLINARENSGGIIPFNREDLPLITHFASIASNSIERAQLIRAMILRMISMAELRDPQETGEHVNRVGGYSVEIYEAWARKKNIGGEEIERNKDTLRISSMLHDVGKVAISDTLLKKKEKLTSEEFAVIKEHSKIGAELFGDMHSEIDEMASEIAMYHHEKWDGSGYPEGKKKDEIPLMARIVALADVYDALSSKRSYKEAFSEEEACRIIRESSDRHFDPEIVEAFFESYEVIENIRKKYSGDLR